MVYGILYLLLLYTTVVLYMYTAAAIKNLLKLLILILINILKIIKIINKIFNNLIICTFKIIVLY